MGGSHPDHQFNARTETHSVVQLAILGRALSERDADQAHVDGNGPKARFSNSSAGSLR